MATHDVHESFLNVVGWEGARGGGAGCGGWGGKEALFHLSEIHGPIDGKKRGSISSF